MFYVRDAFIHFPVPTYQTKLWSKFVISWATCLIVKGPTPVVAPFKHDHESLSMLENHDPRGQLMFVYGSCTISLARLFYSPWRVYLHFVVLVLCVYWLFLEVISSSSFKLIVKGLSRCIFPKLQFGGSYCSVGELALLQLICGGC